MADHLTQEQIEGYRQRTLTPLQLLDVDDHIAACDLCHRKVAGEAPLEGIASALRQQLQVLPEEAPTEVPYEHLAAYIDDTLEPADREILEGQMELYPQVRAQVEDLRAFKTVLGDNLKKEVVPTPPPSAWAWFLSAWRGGGRRLSLQALGTAMVLLVCGGLFYRPLQEELSSTQSELKEAQGAKAEDDLRIAALKQKLGQSETANSQLQAKNGQLQASKSSLEHRIAALSSGHSTAGSVLPPPTRQVLVADAHAGQVTADSAGKVALEVPADSAQEFKKAWVTGHVRVDLPKDLQSLAPRVAVRGGTFAAIRPVGTRALSDRPVFQWRPVPGGTLYALTLTDLAGGAAVSARTGGTEWTPEQPLKRGHTYRWHVDAYPDAAALAANTPLAQTPDARFQVLAQPELAKYANARLLLGVLYAQQGLLDDAEQELQGVIDANPAAPLAQKARQLLDSVQKQRQALQKP